LSSSLDFAYYHHFVFAGQPSALRRFCYSVGTVGKIKRLRKSTYAKLAKFSYSVFSNGRSSSLPCFWIFVNFKRMAGEIRH
jgi:hypothetical protein